MKEQKEKKVSLLTTISEKERKGKKENTRLNNNKKQQQQHKQKQVNKKRPLFTPFSSRQRNASAEQRPVRRRDEGAPGDVHGAGGVRKPNKSSSYDCYYGWDAGVAL